MTYYLVQRKYKYNHKFMKALEEGNEKYIKSLIKKGKLIIMNEKTIEL